MLVRSKEVAVQTQNALNFLWLEITGKCNLSCAHCYAGSSPAGNHGQMTTQAWERVIQQAARMGCKSIQFIGGEPTTHPDLVQFIQLATELEMQIEVYSNLVSVKSKHWDTFQDCQVRLATSFYSLHQDVHEQITGVRYSHAKTIANIQQALALDLPLRVGLVDMVDNQDVDETKQFLTNLGVDRIRVDRMREVGRGADVIQVVNPNDALCGACARGRAAVVPSGDVYPCVFSRHLTIGNVLNHSLGEIVAGEKMHATRTKLAKFFFKKFSKRHSDPDPCIPDGPGSECMPDSASYMQTQDLTSLLHYCEPHECDPNCEPGECNPDLCQPSHTCIPDFKDPCNPVAPCSPDKESCSPEWNKCGPEDR